MADLQKAFPTNTSVHFVSFTTDPAYDSPEVLKRFADKFDANPDRWIFLTGPKADIMKTVVDGLKLVAVDKPAAEQTSSTDLFTHSTSFVVVDKEGQLRASVDTGEPGYQQRLLKIVDFLQAEK